MNTILRYKTGDSHPTEKYLAFVEYCDQGHAIWTSIFGDTDAPYRLATKSGKCLPHCTCGSALHAGHRSDSPFSGGRNWTPISSGRSTS